MFDSFIWQFMIVHFFVIHLVYRLKNERKLVKEIANYKEGVIMGCSINIFCARKCVRKGQSLVRDPSLFGRVIVRKLWNVR